MEDPSPPAPPPAKRKRASRKGQPKRFDCQHEGCDKRYSRAEHLARHELNRKMFPSSNLSGPTDKEIADTPKQIYRCEREGCESTFVRLDLYMRHHQKHDEVAARPRSSDKSATPRPDGRSSQQPPTTLNFQSPLTAPLDFSQTSYVRTGPDGTANVSQWRLNAQGGPLPTPTSSLVNQPHQTMQPALGQGTGAQLTFSNVDESWLPDQAIPGADAYMSTQNNDNFAAWLFESPGSQPQEFDLTNLPFVDFGLEYSPNEVWTFDSSIPAAIAPRSEPQETQLRQAPEEILSNEIRERYFRLSAIRHDAIIATIDFFVRKKSDGSETSLPNSTFLSPGDGGRSNCTIEVLEGCILAFWHDVAKQLPVIHQPTFSCNDCHLLLLLSMITLGAGQLVRLRPKGTMHDYRAFADFLATYLRWAIFTEDDAQPPVQLWVAQALLLLELYEKMFTTRRLHERAHIHHASTLTLLRRGSPMVGRSGSETPPSGMPTRPATPIAEATIPHFHKSSSLHRWWHHWAQNEAMHRVVFSAFQMDALHAVLFGHESVLLPYEVRLSLPCDDSLWAAGSPEEVRRMEETFTMYNIKPIAFLDGLKRCLHGQDVNTHHDARMMLVTGLLSVAWHINRREKHLQFLETIPSANEQEKWRTMLLQAFGHWRQSFEAALSSSKARNGSSSIGRDVAAEPSVLHYAAYITTHVDIIDMQVFAGSKRLLGRKVSQKDYATVVHRMRAWSSSAAARLAVLHAFKLLHETLVQPSITSDVAVPLEIVTIRYACRADALIYRPWILYLAGLTIWSYQYASNLRCHSRRPINTDVSSIHHKACQYISNCASPESADRLLILMSSEGCIAVLQILADDFAHAESELLSEASKRLKDCIAMLTGSAT